MKELVKHLLQNNLERIIDRSLLNCHAKGLHSIMLLESPQQTIRLYVAKPGNELYKNSHHFYKQGMSIGFHPHHCNLTLHCIKGKFVNWTIHKPILPDYHRSTTLITLREYIYHSQITEGVQGFELTNSEAQMLPGEMEYVKEGETLRLNAKSLHTVVCGPFELTAWLVYEGKEDPMYQPLCYSTSHLEEISTDGLYEKPTKEQVIEMLFETGLIDYDLRQTIYINEHL